jgi:hypothetical protein
MNRPAHVLIAFALESLPAASLTRQAEVYRAIAEMSARRSERARFERLAASCDEQIARQQAHANEHEQLVLDFKKGAL